MHVIPAKAGIQGGAAVACDLDPGFRRGDEQEWRLLWRARLKYVHKAVPAGEREEPPATSGRTRNGFGAVRFHARRPSVDSARSKATYVDLLNVPAYLLNGLSTCAE